MSALCNARRIALGAVLLLSFPLSALAQSTTTGMTVRHDVHHDVSAPLGDLIKAAPAPSLVQHEAEPVGRIPLPPGLSPNAEDPVLQTSVVPQTPVTGLSFEALAPGQYVFTRPTPPPT